MARLRKDRFHLVFILLLLLGLLNHVNSSTTSVGVSSMTNQHESLIQPRGATSTTTTKTATVKGPCEEQLTEDRCEKNAQGNTDIYCLWIGLGCITLPLGTDVVQEVVDPISSTPVEQSPPSNSPIRQTDDPSRKPSKSPTGVPTNQPTSTPSKSPSIKPVSVMSSSMDESIMISSESLPNKSPPTDVSTSSLDMSRSPSISPIHSPMIYEVPAVMILHGADEMDQDTIEAWIQITHDKISDEAEEIIVGDEGEGLVVTVQINYQEAVFERRKLLKHHTSIGSERANRQQRRNLGKFESSSLKIDFTTTIENIIGDDDDWNPNEVVAAGFQTQAQQREYIDSLKTSDDSASFEGVQSMTMEVDGILVTETTQVPNIVNSNDNSELMDSNVINNNNNDGESIPELSIPELQAPDTMPLVESIQSINDNENTVYYMIGGAATLLLLLAGSIGVMFYNRKSNKSSSPHGNDEDDDALTGKLDIGLHNTHSPERTSATASTTMSPMSQTIESQRMEDDDDISALRDPYFGDEADSQRLHSDVTVDVDSILSSDRRLYEFGVRGGGLQRVGTSTTMTTTTGGTGANNGNRTLFTDDGTLEEIYQSPDGRPSYENDGGSCSDKFQKLTVVAPSGQMGIVIDNPTASVGEVRGSGMPMVHAIKETSVLRGKVRVGDLLISVDDVDCRGMSATQVTRVISGRSGNAERILILLRGGSSALGNC